MGYPIRNTIGSFPTYLWLDEAEIIDALITAILNRGFVISVFDGEDWAVKRSADRAKIQREIAATDETQLIIRDTEGNRRGWFLLIHGNRAHVVSDYVDNDLCNELWNEIEPLVEKWEGQWA